ncbi:hypothetical protein PV326_009033, partial [Microctonus aethiopoides]
MELFTATKDFRGRNSRLTEFQGGFSDVRVCSKRCIIATNSHADTLLRPYAKIHIGLENEAFQDFI